MNKTELEKYYNDYFDNFGKDFDFIWLKNFLNHDQKFSLTELSLKEIALKLGLNKYKL